MDQLPFQHPRVGVGVIVLRDGKVLLGKRKGSHGEGFYAFPGGSLELFESPFDCARRESLEEAGIYLQNLSHGPWTDDQFPEAGKHFGNLIVVAEWASGEPRVCEPDKCEGWGWYDWHQMPKPLFHPINDLLERGYDPR